MGQNSFFKGTYIVALPASEIKVFSVRLSQSRIHKLSRSLELSRPGGYVLDVLLPIEDQPK